MQPESQNYWHKGDEKRDDSPTINSTYAPQPDDEMIQNTPIERKPHHHEASDDEPLHWSAHEYVVQEKAPLWFILLAIVALALIALDIIYLKSYTFSALVVVMFIALIVYSRRPPRLIEYTLSGTQGLYIGNQLRHYSEFRAFGLIQEKDKYSIVLIPIKRFSPAVSVYFPSEVGEKLVDIFGARLPMQNLKLDFFDVIIRKLGI
ncbi:hypothetical protein HGB24_03600 [Candidatus Saccharibacteria bacterium]|nr:hypothetical protein [Candidatus Saccharibacteria bacterium]